MSHSIGRFGSLPIGKHWQTRNAALTLVNWQVVITDSEAENGQRCGIHQAEIAFLAIQAVPVSGPRLHPQQQFAGQICRRLCCLPADLVHRLGVVVHSIKEKPLVIAGRMFEQPLCRGSNQLPNEEVSPL